MFCSLPSANTLHLLRSLTFTPLAKTKANKHRNRQSQLPVQADSFQTEGKGHDSNDLVRDGVGMVGSDGRYSRVMCPSQTGSYDGLWKYKL